MTPERRRRAPVEHLVIRHLSSSVRGRRACAQAIAYLLNPRPIPHKVPACIGLLLGVAAVQAVVVEISPVSGMVARRSSGVGVVDASGVGETVASTSLLMGEY